MKNKKDEGGLWTAKFSEVVTSLQILEKNGFTREMLDCLRGPDGNNIAQKIIAQFYDPSLNRSFYKDSIEEWEVFYKKYFDVSIDLSKIKIPKVKRGFERLIIAISDISLIRIIEATEKNFPVIVDPKEKNINKIIDERGMTEKGPYAVWVRDWNKPDPESLGESAFKMSLSAKATATLKERLIHGLKYWDETERHLDVDVATLCSGTKSVAGMVPMVSFSCLSSPNKNTLLIEWIKPDESYGKVGAREVIPCDK